VADKQQTWRFLLDEQADFVASARTLTPEQWATPSLCTGWSVRDVVVHAAAGRKSLGKTLVLWASVGFGSAAKANARELDLNRDRSVDSVIDWLASPLKPKGLLDMQNQLRGLMIHQQDARRPLGLGRDIPADRLHAVLDTALTRMGSANVGSKRRAEGLRLVATDIDWSAGDGPEVQGSGEAILMTISGRLGAIEELTGEGTETLAARL
jgi:uncharacterized protein (TIGR03083 family)